MFKLESSYRSLFIFLLALLICHFIIFRNLPFFWDAISKSSRASWIYSNHFEDLILPTNEGSGHPQLWTTLIALFWTVFGKTLATTRFLLLLVNIGVVYQILSLFKFFFKKKVSPYLVLIVFLDPTFLAQTTSLNNDMLLLFFTLLGLNAVLKQRQIFLFIGLVGMLFTNLRGIYITIALAITQMIYFRNHLIQPIRRLWLPFVSSVLIYVIYCLVHYNKLGWVIITPNPSYSSHRETATLNHILVNTIVFVKILLEYGRIFLYGILAFLLFKYWKSKNEVPTERVSTLKLISVPILVFGSVFFFGMVPFSNPIGTRYFMIVFLLLMMLTIYLIQVLNLKYSKIIYTSIILGLLSGHFWVYPTTLSQSWDSSLSYLNYYPLEKKMETYLESNQIPRNTVGTRIRFNERDNSNLIHLGAKSKYEEFNLDANEYIILSNIENATKDDELLQVMNNWKLIKSYKQLGVFLSLYKNPTLK